MMVHRVPNLLIDIEHVHPRRKDTTLRLWLKGTGRYDSEWDHTHCFFLVISDTLRLFNIAMGNGP